MPIIVLGSCDIHTQISYYSVNKLIADLLFKAANLAASVVDSNLPKIFTIKL